LIIANLEHGEHRCVGDDDDDPCDGECDGRVADVAYRHGGDGMNDGQIAIKGHQDERIDASVSRYVHYVLIYLHRTKHRPPMALEAIYCIYVTGPFSGAKRREKFWIVPPLYD